MLVIEETPISNQFRSGTCDEDRPPIVCLSSKRCGLEVESPALILTIIIDDLNDLASKTKNEL